uniref:F-box domain-containing protein n=1 Tax=Panagrellus redivivus TaxID=6233 RepID=A0A7E4V7I7_PANRE
MRCHNANWISEILQVKEHSLMDLYLSYEQCDEFDENLLLTFLKAQRPRFKLVFTSTQQNMEPFVGKLMKFVDQNLVRGYGPKQTEDNGLVRWARTRVTINSGESIIVSLLPFYIVVSSILAAIFSIMPYPIAKLAYGLRSRLTDLTTNRELYSLQIAAGYVPLCPLKLQTVQENVQNIHFACENKTVSAHKIYDTQYKSAPIEIINEDVLVNVGGESIGLHFLDAEALKSNIFDHFFCNPTILDIKNCRVSKPFYETIRKLFPKTNFIFLVADIFTSSFVNFTDLLTAFPNVQTVNAMYYHNANWISEILQVKQHSLMDLTLSYTCIEQCGEFDANNLLTFLKAQRPGFQLMLFMPKQKVGPFITELMKFVDQKLARGFGPKQTDSNGTVRWTNTRFKVFNGYEINKTWYLPRGNNVQVL